MYHCILHSNSKRIVRQSRKENRYLELVTDRVKNCSYLFCRLLLGSCPFAAVFGCRSYFASLFDPVPCLFLHLLSLGMLQGQRQLQYLTVEPLRWNDWHQFGIIMIVW